MKRKPSYRLMKTVAFVTIVLLTLCATLFYTQLLPQNADASPHMTYTVDVETYLKMRASPAPVSSIYAPMMIYHHHTNGAPDTFIGLGTGYNDERGVGYIFTSEHIFRKDAGTGPIILRVEYVAHSHRLNGYLGRIEKTSTDMLGSDTLIARLTSKPYVHTPFSSITKKVDEDTFWMPVFINGKKVDKVTSLITGTSHRVLGLSYPKLSTKPHLVIDMRSYQGESGSGFIDEYGGLWSLHAQITDASAESRAIQSCKASLNIEPEGITTIAGPFCGSYK